MGYPKCGSMLKRGMPVHVAIIPDGNRRWARKHGLPVWRGHYEGYRVAKMVLNELWDLGVKYVTFYGLSRENCIRRGRDELQKLYSLLGMAVDDLLSDERVSEGRVRVYFVGDMSLLPSWLSSKMLQANEATVGNGPSVVSIGVCYGGRWEVLEAVRKIVSGSLELGRELDEEGFRRLLPLGWLPEPDLIIRTGGELRLSGFLLYHAAYSELYFTKTLWPDFGRDELYEAICSFRVRERRFGR